MDGPKVVVKSEANFLSLKKAPIAFFQFSKMYLTTTLRSLLNELDRLTIVTIFKRASSFNRDLRVVQLVFVFS